MSEIEQMLSVDNIQVGKTYRAKRPLKQWGEVVNDREVLYISPNREFVQYDSRTVANGRHYPKVTMERFLKWAASEIPSQP